MLIVGYQPVIEGRGYVNLIYPFLKESGNQRCVEVLLDTKSLSISAGENLIPINIIVLKDAKDVCKKCIFRN